MSKGNYKNLLALITGLFSAFIILELALRIFHPFPFILKGDNIILQRGKKEVFRNTEIPKLDTLIYHSTNSIGFRGPEKPVDFESFLTIFMVGGSTTECRFLSDGKDWPALLAKDLNEDFRVWINNAGLDGHSTFGHLQLLNEHLVGHHPKVIIFLVGRNDVLRDDLKWDSRANERMFKEAVNFFSRSEVFSLLYNLNRVYKARNRNLKHFNLDLKTSEKLSIPDGVIEQQVQAHRKSFLPSYQHRLQMIIDTCRKNGIEPVFITQPALVGKGIDSVTQVDLATVKTGESENGKLLWRVLELYNGATKETGDVNGCLVIDLAGKMPKNSRYFYDYIHFTNEGAEVVADIVFKDLSSWFYLHYPDFIIKPANKQ